MTYTSIKTIQPQESRSIYIDNPILRELNFNNDFDFVKRVSVSGISRTITPNAYVDIRDSGNFDYSIEPTKISVVSSSVQDSIVGGTGIQVLRIEGLNENFVEIMETVVLTGTTAVQTSNTFLRVKNTLALLVGSNKNSVGDITATGGGTTFFSISNSRPITTQLGSYTVPADKTFILTDINIIGERNITFNVMQMLKAPNLPEQSRLTILSTDSPYVSYFQAKIPEKTDIWFKTKIETGTGNKTCHISFSGLLFDNNMLNGL